MSRKGSYCVPSHPLLPLAEFEQSREVVTGLQLFCSVLDFGQNSEVYLVKSATAIYFLKMCKYDECSNYSQNADISFQPTADTPCLLLGVSRSPVLTQSPAEASQRSTSDKQLLPSYPPEYAELHNITITSPYHCPPVTRKLPPMLTPRRFLLGEGRCPVRCQADVPRVRTSVEERMLSCSAVFPPVTTYTCITHHDNISNSQIRQDLQLLHCWAHFWVVSWFQYVTIRG